MVKNGHRLCRPTTVDAWAASKFWTYMEEGTCKAQTSPACTQPIQETVRSWVKGKRAWFGGGERGKPILGFLLGLFWGKCPARMTYYPNGQSWARATRCTPWGIGIEKAPIPGPMVISRYAQTRKMWLMAKIVKYGHDMHYKKGLCHAQEQQ